MIPLWLVLSLVPLGVTVEGGAGDAGPGIRGGGVGGGGVGGAAPVAEEKWADFAAYPGARRLCSQHVSGNAMHISWTAYATTDVHPKVIAFYVKRHGGKPGKDTLHLSGGKGVRLSVHPAGARDYPTCEVKPAKTDQTVIIVSHAVGPNVK